MSTDRKDWTLSELTDWQKLRIDLWWIFECTPRHKRRLTGMNPETPARSAMHAAYHRRNR